MRTRTGVLHLAPSAALLAVKTSLSYTVPSMQLTTFRPAAPYPLTSDLIAPAAVEGPNHSPTSLPRRLPSRAKRCTEKGESGDGSSRKSDRRRA